MSRATPVHGVYINVQPTAGDTPAAILPVIGLDFDFITGAPQLWVVDPDGVPVKLESLRDTHRIRLLQQDYTVITR